MRTIYLITLLFLLTILAMACGEDHSPFGNNDSGSPITCEDICTVAVECFNEKGDILDFDDCVNDCIEHDKIERFPEVENCVVNADSCDEYWKCHEDD